MGLLKKGAADDTLDVVKDLSKFKKRIKELAKAKADVDNSVAKATTKLQQVNADMDAKIAEAGKIGKAAKELMKSAENMQKTALDDANKVLGEAGKTEKATAARSVAGDTAHTSLLLNLWL